MARLNVSGPNLEVFKFGLYMFFPVWIMFKFGDPEWYNNNVQPYKEILWPPYEQTHRPPRSQPELQTELAKMRALRQEKKDQRAEGISNPQADATGSSITPAGSVAEELRTRKPDWTSEIQQNERLV